MNSDILYVLTSRLNNDALECLSLSSPEVWPLVRQFSSDQYWWYLRACAVVLDSLSKYADQRITHTDLRPRKGADWKRAYTYLEDSVGQDNPFVYALDNTLALSVLLELGYNPRYDEDEAIVIAAERANVEAVKVLLTDPRVDFTASDEIADLLIDKDEVTVLEQFLSDLYLGDGTAIARAAVVGSVKILKLLLAQPDGDPTLTVPYIEGDSLAQAIEAGEIESVRILLEDGRCNPSADSNKLLEHALINEQDEIIALLLADERVQEGLREDGLHLDLS